MPPLVITLSPFFKLLQHLRDFLLAPLGGHDHQEIKDHHDQDQREEAAQKPTRLGLRLQRQKTQSAGSRNSRHMSIIVPFPPQRRNLPQTGRLTRPAHPKMLLRLCRAQRPLVFACVRRA